MYKKNFQAAFRSHQTCCFLCSSSIEGLYIFPVLHELYYSQMTLPESFRRHVQRLLKKILPNIFSNRTQKGLSWRLKKFSADHRLRAIEAAKILRWEGVLNLRSSFRHSHSFEEQEATAQTQSRFSLVTPITSGRNGKRHERGQNESA